MTDVGGVDELARIAEHFDRMVLHTVVDGRDVFLVDDGVAVYRVVLDSTAGREGCRRRAACEGTMRRRVPRRGQRRRRRPVVAVVALVAVVGIAVTATNTIPVSRADDLSRAIGVNDVKPSQCAGLTLTDVLAGSGTINDPNGNATLVLGSAGADTINARNLDDCVVAGGGNDSINGGAGSDVCIGGPGTDTFTNCETSYQ